MDAKYNSSTQELVERDVTGLKWVSSQSDKIKHSTLQFTSVGHRSAVSAVVGSKNPFDLPFTQWQYLDTFVNWGGSFFEGLIQLPSADSIEAAHKNGVKMYGNVFLDGYHGLTKPLLEDFTKKDLKGNYLIVDKLIELASESGFDGYFWNNEPNGELPNGTILDYREVYEMIVQFKNKVKASKDPRVNKLEMEYYKNNGRMVLDVNGNPEDIESMTMGEISGIFQNNFNYTPNHMESFFKSQRGQEYVAKEGKYNIYNMVEISRPGLTGLFDTRAMTNFHLDPDGNRYGPNDKQRESADKAAYAWTYEDEPTMSFSNYSDDASAFGGATAKWLLAMSKEFKENDPTEAKKFIFSQQFANIYEDLMYSGRNRFLRGTKDVGQGVDKGVTQNGWSGTWMGNGTDGNRGIRHESILQSLDIFPKLTPANGAEWPEMSESQKNILEPKDERGNFITTFGSGTVKQEKTVIIDKNPEFKTNFSTGSGIFFKDKNGNQVGGNEFDDAYPWTNKRLQDVQPTYRWDVREYQNGKSEEELLNFSQSELSGFFDYYNMYQKGNSIALAKSIDIDGSLVGSTLKKSKPVLWNIMGANLKNDKNLKLRYKVKLNSDSEKTMEELMDLKASVILNTGTLENPVSKTMLLDAKITEDAIDNEWKNVEVQLPDASEGIISKLGLQISPKEDIENAVFNVGELETFISNSDTDNNNKTITDLNIEYIVKREDELNIRFGWKIDQKYKKDIDYYEIYEQKNGKLYRLGETTQDIYFVKKVQYNPNIKLVVKPVFKSGNNNNMYSFNVKLD
ncbi:endo-beta-N-acetylglucosaminidase [[Acholeplasma] multilocale]|uniref:endo-beta-N-acetylglucosaminidase n=1 Tax=[Acholeplasma] multilocale TaxID=264638 RepID=UPI00047952DB|nr:hypothetical protein [[Acholeplasma] multilocale]